MGGDVGAGSAPRHGWPERVPSGSPALYDPAVVSEELLQILACPKCKGKVELVEDGTALQCDNCRLRYPITDGIPVMLIEEAKPY
jgi:uncharacterized protein YbaR (Trm112 family)